jgi:uncharacterized membrane protein
MPTDDRIAAQRRADRIRAFREELAAAEADRAIALDPAQRDGLDHYHDALLATLRREHQVDVTLGEQQLSRSMRIASAIGALALATGLWFLFYEYWDRFSTAGQVALLVTGPVAAILATEWLHRRDVTGYFSQLAALVALACFVVDLATLGTIFNAPPDSWVFLLWSAFAFVLAYGYGHRLLLVAAILLACGYVNAAAGVWSGMYWLDLGRRPELFILIGLCFAILPTVVAHRVHTHFPPAYRVLGLTAAFLAMIVLGNWGHSSYLPLPPGVIEVVYQVAGFAATAAAIGIGIRRGWPHVANTGMTFFGILFFTKVFDWWWALVPRFAFFFILAALAIGYLFVVRRLHGLGEAPR